MEQRAVVILIFVFYLCITCASGQCSSTGFDTNVEVVAPLDTITFDNIGLSGSWLSGSPALRITPAESMEVTITGVTDNYNYVRVGSGLAYISQDLSTTWNRGDNYVSFQAYRNTATMDFASPIRQFSLQLAHDNACYASGWPPTITLTNTTGGTITCIQINVPPTLGSVNEYRIFRYRSATANVKKITLSRCAFVFDNIRYKVDPCSPTPCNPTENCYDVGGLDPFCCAKNATWNGVKCLKINLFINLTAGDPCLDATTCDPLASCKTLKTGGYKCTCPLKYTGNGSPGNCIPIPPILSNSTYNIVPILECIDANNVAQFGYQNNETELLLIDDTLRNNLEPFELAPVEVFAPGRSRPYPLNPGQVPLNIASELYAWNLEGTRLEFSNAPAVACPIQLSVIFRFAISGTVNVTLFAAQTRLAFISTANVTADRVTLVNVTNWTPISKRSAMQLDTDLEVELSVSPPTNNKEPSSADVIRDFVQDRQDDFEYELNKANPNNTISTSVSAKGSYTADYNVPIGQEPITSANPIATPTTNNSTAPTKSAITSSGHLSRQLQRAWRLALLLCFLYNM